MLSSELLSELSRVLSYERLRRIHQLDDAAIEQFVENVETGSLIVAPADPAPRVVPHDADDDIVVATAVAGNANVICTRNRHLYHADVVDFCHRHAIRIVSDLELLVELRQNDSADTETQPD